MKTGVHGFTLLEVVLILLVVVMGLLGVVGLVAYGMNLASRSQGMTLGMATAISVAHDPEPLLDASMTASWSCTPLDIDTPGIATGSATGFVNGFYVVRSETSAASDIVASSGPKVYVRWCSVQVDVYDSMKGRPIAAYNTQLLRQRGTP